MGTISSVISLLCMVAVSSTNIGDPAPSLEGNHWIKGNLPVYKNQVTIVELWRTTCPNCKAEIPHLTALQKKYGNRIAVVAVSVEPLDILEEFVKINGDQMGYTLGKLTKEMGDPFNDGVKTVPQAFLINKDGLIVWKGHPSQIDDILAKTVEGKINVDQLREIETLEISLNEAMNTNDPDKIDPIYKKLLLIDPSNTLALDVGMKMAKYYGEPEMVKEMFDKIQLTGLSGDKAAIFAVMLMSESYLAFRYPEAAVKFSLYAMKQNPKNDFFMDTYARLLYCLGDIEKAIIFERKAIDSNSKEGLYKTNLDYYLSINAIKDKNQSNVMNGFN